MPTDLPPGAYRARVSYIAQHPPRLPGTPLDFFKQVLSFAANADVREGFAELASAEAAAAVDEESMLRERRWTGPGWRLSDAALEFGDSATASMNGSLVSLSEAQVSRNASSAAPLTLGLGFPAGVTLSTSGTSTPHKLASSTGATAASTSAAAAYALPIEPWTLAARHWALPEAAFTREWAQLSGGEVARAALAIGLTLQARRRSAGVLLLDGASSPSHTLLTLH